MIKAVPSGTIALRFAGRKSTYSYEHQQLDAIRGRQEPWAQSTEWDLWPAQPFAYEIWSVFAFIKRPSFEQCVVWHGQQATPDVQSILLEKGKWSDGERAPTGTFGLKVGLSDPYGALPTKYVLWLWLERKSGLFMRMEKSWHWAVLSKE